MWLPHRTDIAKTEKGFAKQESKRLKYLKDGVDYSTGRCYFNKLPSFVNQPRNDIL